MAKILNKTIQDYQKEIEGLNAVLDARNTRINSYYNQIVEMEKTINRLNSREAILKELLKEFCKG